VRIVLLLVTLAAFGVTAGLYVRAKVDAHYRRRRAARAELAELEENYARLNELRLDDHRSPTRTGGRR
jgi:hypothetical protein